MKNSLQKVLEVSAEINNNGKRFGPVKNRVYFKIWSGWLSK